MVSTKELNKALQIRVLTTPLVPAEILSQSCVSPPNFTRFVVTEFPLLSSTTGQVLPAPGMASTGPMGPIPKQVKPGVIASPSNLKTPLESSTPPPVLLN